LWNAFWREGLLFTPKTYSSCWSGKALWKRPTGPFPTISNIEGLLKALERQIGPDVLQKEAVRQIYGLLNNSVNRFKTTIGDLTEVARISKESAEDVASLDLAQVLDEVLQDLEPQWQEARAQLTIQLHCQSLHFSRKNAKSILYNLLSNAFKYRSPERNLQVSIGCGTEGDYHELTVRDNGLGIDMRQKEKIFALFKRLHTHVEGTGIGLYIVKKMIENAGGKIEVESRVDVGSTFRVYFKR
jgi:signal transduction histidine kinase